MESHLDSHKALKPLSLGANDDARTAVVAKYLDMAQDALAVALGNVFPESASSLDRWEASYGLDGVGTEGERRASVVAAVGAVGGISLPFFVQLAESLGYQVSFRRGIEMFRVGISLLGIDPLYSANLSSLPVPDGWDVSEMGEYSPDMWTCTVTVLSLGANTNASSLKASFESRKPPFCFFKWEGLS